MIRKTLIAASLFAAFAAQAAQNDAEQQRQVLEMEGVGHVLPAAAPAQAGAARTANGLFTQATLKTSASREAVVAELARARAAGEMDFVREEIGSYLLPQTPQTGETRLARWFKR